MIGHSFWFKLPLFVNHDRHVAIQVHVDLRKSSKVQGMCTILNVFFYCYSQRWTRNEAIRRVEPCIWYGARDLPGALSLCHISLWSSLPLRQVSWLPRWLHITPRCSEAKLTATCFQCVTGTPERKNFFLLLCQPKFWKWSKGVVIVE